MRRAILPVLAVALAAGGASVPALAHETRPGYLELRQTGEETFDVTWKVPRRGDLRLGLEVDLPEACTPLTPLSSRKAEGAWIDRWTVSCPGGLVGRSVGVEGLSARFTDALVRFERADGTTQVELLTPASASFAVEGAPSLIRVAGTYLRLGVVHILLGIDHLLFVLGLLFIVRSGGMLVKTITSFTLAHSMTLAVATLGYASAPGPPLNAAIALSILFLGPEIVRRWRGESSFTIRHPWVVAFAFGLLHGFGFASGLTTTGLPQAEIPLALLMFNVGVELGQLAFVAVILLVYRSLRTLEFHWYRWVELVPGYAIGSLGTYWTIQRTVLMF